MIKTANIKVISGLSWVFFVMGCFQCDVHLMKVARLQLKPYMGIIMLALLFDHDILSHHLKVCCVQFVSVSFECCIPQHTIPQTILAKIDGHKILQKSIFTSRSE